LIAQPEHATPPATPPTPPPTPPNHWALVAIVLALTALLAAAIGWYQTDQEIAELRNAFARLANELRGSREQPPVSMAGAPALGPAGATVVLIEFSDYECPYCIRHFQQTMPQIVNEFVKTGRIRYVFRDWPVDQLHPEAIRAHQAGHCAAEQQRFWEIHPKLFGPPGSHGRDRLIEVARSVGVDERAFASCLDSDRTTRDIRDTSQLALELGATGTPAFFLGRRDPATEMVTIVRAISGAQPYSVFARAIEETIKSAAQ
jgi:protein-disulfide isomerase